MRRMLVELVACTTLIIDVAVCGAYGIETHARISRAASTASELGKVLAALAATKDSTFDVPSIELEVNNGTAIGWIQEGSVREDGDSKCDSRVSNHFYNPISNSGFSFSVYSGNPSTDWGLEDTSEISEQDFSYRNARQSYWSALTSPTEEERQRHFALTFRSIGQVIHLLQDAAQPQHTRNDAHAGKCVAGLIGPESLYEHYVDDLAKVDGVQYTGYPVVQAARPRDYWDTGFGEGIAEFSNRNFVTVGTNFRGRPDALQPAPGFPMPSGAGAATAKVDVQELVPGAPLHGKLTFIGTPYDDQYAETAGFNPRTSSFSIFNSDLTRRNLLASYTINRFNIEAAQSVLIPRAVGYSAGMINYFFRGKLEISAPDRLAYAVTSYTPDLSGTFSRVDLKLRNATPDETMGRGTVQAIVRYRKGWPNPLMDPTWALEPVPTYAVSAPKDIELTEELQSVSFDFKDDPIALNAGEVSILVAFRGPLISDAYTEEDGIAIGTKDLYEPDLIDFGNITDYACFNSGLYYTPGLTDAQRDVDRDGGRDLYGPWQLEGNYFRIRRLNESFGFSSADDANFTVPAFAAAEYARAVVIQDQDQYVATHTVQTATETSTGYTTPAMTWGVVPATINRLVDWGGRIVHEIRFPYPTMLRGSNGARRIFYADDQVVTNPACRDAMPSQSPAIRPIPGTVNEGAQP